MPASLAFCSATARCSASYFLTWGMWCVVRGVMYALCITPRSQGVMHPDFVVSGLAGIGAETRASAMASPALLPMHICCAAGASTGALLRLLHTWLRKFMGCHGFWLRVTRCVCQWHGLRG